MSEIRYFPAWAPRGLELIRHLEARYKNQGYDVQVLELREPGADAPPATVLQVRERYQEDWQKTLSTVTGLDTAATVTAKAQGDALEVEVGGGKWLDKATVAGAAAFLSAGILLVPAGIGAFKQRRLLLELTEEVEAYVRGRSAEPAPSETPTEDPPRDL